MINSIEYNGPHKKWGFVSIKIYGRSSKAVTEMWNKSWEFLYPEIYQDNKTTLILKRDIRGRFLKP